MERNAPYAQCKGDSCSMFYLDTKAMLVAALEIWFQVFKKVPCGKFQVFQNGKE